MTAAHAWSAGWMVVSVAMLVYASSALVGSGWSATGLAAAALFGGAASGASGVGVAGARLLLGKSLRTWWYAAPLLIAALGTTLLTVLSLLLY